MLLFDGEAGVFGAESYVGCAHKVNPPTNAGAMHRNDGRLRTILNQCTSAEAIETIYAAIGQDNQMQCDMAMRIAIEPLWH